TVRPHVTVARVGHPQDVTNWFRLLDTYDDASWSADRVTVFASHLGEGPRKTPRHEVMAAVTLGCRSPGPGQKGRTTPTLNLVLSSTATWCEPGTTQSASRPSEETSTSIRAERARPRALSRVRCSDPSGNCCTTPMRAKTGRFGPRELIVARTDQLRSVALVAPKKPPVGEPSNSERVL